MPVKRSQRDARRKTEKQGQAIKTNEERVMAKEIEKVELFAVGRWNGMEFTIEDLNSMAAAFHELGDNHRVPLKFGHNEEQPITDGLPAIGKVEDVWVEGEKLIGSFTNVPQIVFDAIQNKLYDKVSIELDMGVEYKGSYYPWVLSGVALLGADIPAVNTLSDLSAFMTRGDDFTSNKLVNFSRSVTIQEEDDMSEELKAKIAALEAQNAELLKEKTTFAVKNQQLEAEAEKRIAEQKAAEFNRSKSALITDLDALVKADVITPAKRDTIASEISDKDGVIERLQYTVGVMKDMAPNLKFLGNDSGGTGKNDGDEEGMSPDSVLAARAFKIARENKMSFSAAQQVAMQEDPELAKQYIFMNGIKGGA